MPHRAPGSPGQPTRNYLSGKPIKYYRPQGSDAIRQLVDNGFQAFNAGRLSEACHIFTDKMLDPAIKLTSSMGIASFPQDADTPEGLFDAADKRHYQAKRQGRNRMVSKDVDDPADPAFDPTPRLIGRETALETVYQFFDHLGRRKQGTLFVSGVRGIGKTRFLEEVAKIARLHGHLVE